MSEGAHHKLLLAASEAVPFAKTGGLADVAGSLPRALAQRGHECAVILPLYAGARSGKTPITPTDHTFSVPVGNRYVAGRLWRSELPGTDVPVYLVEQPDYYERDDPARGFGLYQYTAFDGRKSDYPDNCERFVFFSRAVLEAMALLGYWPDVLHLNDWQTGLVPVYLREHYLNRPRYGRVRTLFTIHNIAYQGVFWHLDMPLTGLDWRLFNYRQLEYYGSFSFLKAGIVFADLLNTVSPTYAREIATSSEYGRGMDGLLAERRDRLFGIVNGVDYGVWNPGTDRHIAAPYDLETVEEGKARCKAVLQHRFGLRADLRAPLLGMISRLVDQKGLSVLARAADAILQDGAQLVVLGEGEAGYQHMLAALRDRYPEQVGVVFSHDEPLAHQIEAGADIYVMPSQFEPCGLNQLYSLKYGTVPVVRATGGLADTVTDCRPETVAAGTATGFSFEPYSAGAFREAVRRATDAYRNQPDVWRQLVGTGMRQDWSWDHSAAEYERLYARLRGTGAA
jgi:starch synthase